jgi:limonene-1,2-epoxide hydrolase
MTNYPDTTVQVTSIEPAGKAKVRIIFEMIVDVHRLAEVGEEMLHEAMDQVRDEQATKTKTLATLLHSG